MTQETPKPAADIPDAGNAPGGQGMRSVGLVLHPARDSAEAVEAVLGWASRKEITVFGIADEICRLGASVVPVTAVEIGRCSDLVVSLGGDGTMLRAMRLADRQRAPVLGVNLGRLGFLAEVDVPDLPGALSAIDSRKFTIECRLAIDGGRLAIEVDGAVAGYAAPGQRIGLQSRPAAARVVRLGRTTFYERARRKLRLTDSAEILATWPDDQFTEPETTPHARDRIPAGGRRG